MGPALSYIPHPPHTRHARRPRPCTSSHCHRACCCFSWRGFKITAGSSKHANIPASCPCLLSIESVIARKFNDPGSLCASLCCASSTFCFMVVVTMVGSSTLHPFSRGAKWRKQEKDNSSMTPNRSSEIAPLTLHVGLDLVCIIEKCCPSIFLTGIIVADIPRFGR